LFDEVDKVVYGNEIFENTHVSFGLSNGYLSYSILAYPSSLTTYSITFTADRYNEPVYLNVTYTINSTGITSILVNDVERLLEVSNESLPIYEYDFIDGSGNAIISKNDYDVRFALISTFTIITKTDIAPSVYLNILRNAVIPAGFRLIHLYLISNEVFGDIMYNLYTGTVDTPTYMIKFTSPYPTALYSVYDFDSNVFSNYNKYFFGTEDLDHVEIKYFTNTTLYRSTPIYSIATSTVKPRIIYTSLKLISANVTGTEMFSGTINDTDVLDSTELKLHRIDDMYISTDPNSIDNLEHKLFNIFYRTVDVGLFIDSMEPAYNDDFYCTQNYNIISQQFTDYSNTLYMICDVYDGSINFTNYILCNHLGYKINEINLSVLCDYSMNNRLYETMYRPADIKISYESVPTDDIVLYSDMFSGTINDTDVLDSTELKLHRIDDMYISTDPNNIPINNNERLYNVIYRSTDVSKNT
jgi:hypothetical protein